jgi:hypothetical protein
MNSSFFGKSNRIVRDASEPARIFLQLAVQIPKICGLLPKIVTQKQLSFAGAKFLDRTPQNPLISRCSSRPKAFLSAMGL